MADSEGTFQLGVTDAAAMALTDFGQWSPAAEPDLWASADLALMPVAQRALKRVAMQAAELASGERAFTLGIRLGASKLLTPGAVAAETALDAVRIRRPAEIRCAYDGAAATGPLYAYLAVGFGSGVAFAVDAVSVVGTVAMRLKTVIVNCVSTAPGASDIILGNAGGAIATASTVDLEMGVNTIDFLTVAGTHSVAAGDTVTMIIDTTAAHGIVALLLQFEEVPA